MGLSETNEKLESTRDPGGALDVSLFFPLLSSLLLFLSLSFPPKVVRAHCKRLIQGAMVSSGGPWGFFGSPGRLWGAVGRIWELWETLEIRGGPYAVLGSPGGPWADPLLRKATRGGPFRRRVGPCSFRVLAGAPGPCKREACRAHEHGPF